MILVTWLKMITCPNNFLSFGFFVLDFRILVLWSINFWSIKIRSIDPDPHFVWKKQQILRKSFRIYVKKYIFLENKNVTSLFFSICDVFDSVFNAGLLFLLCNPFLLATAIKCNDTLAIQVFLGFKGFVEHQRWLSFS